MLKIVSEIERKTKILETGKTHTFHAKCGCSCPVLFLNNVSVSRLSVPVVTSLYLVCRVWWVLSVMERVGVNTRESRVNSADTLLQQADNVVDNSTDNNNDRSVV